MIARQAGQAMGKGRPELIGKSQYCRAQVEFPLGEASVLLLGLSSHWMRLTQITEVNLISLRSADG